MLIGVNDLGEVLGLDDDLSTLGTKANRDGFELFLRQLLDTSLSTTTAATVGIRFNQVANKDLCVVTVGASGKPIFANAPR